MQVLASEHRFDPDKLLLWASFNEKQKRVLREKQEDSLYVCWVEIKGTLPTVSLKFIWSELMRKSFDWRMGYFTISEVVEIYPTTKRSESFFIQWPNLSFILVKETWIDVLITHNDAKISFGLFKNEPPSLSLLKVNFGFLF